MKDSFVIESETDGVPAPFHDEKEKALQRIASSLERLELILRQLGGAENPIIRFGTSGSQGTEVKRKSTERNVKQRR